MAKTAQNIITDCDNAIKAHQTDLTRAFEIWDAYYAVNGRQWDSKKREDLRQEDRHAWQFDVLGPKLETLAGSLAAEIPDLDWIPVEGERTESTEAVREQYYADKEHFNYNTSLLYTIRDGCVHSGWCQMLESNKYSPTGGIKLERCRPGYIIPDPYWVTDDDRDLECLYKIGYFWPEQLKKIYKKKAKELDSIIEDRKRFGQRYISDLSTDKRDDRQREYKSEVGDQIRVIEKYYLEEIIGERLIGLKKDTEQYISFPFSQDRNFLASFGEANGVDWTNVNPVEYREKKQRICTVTDLEPDLILEEGETREQVNGLSFFHFTCMRYNGHDKGIGEAILDAQRVINEKESYLLEYMAKAGGGAELWNEEMFKNEEQKKRFRKNKNKFGHVEFVDLDAVRTARVDVNPAQVPSAVFAEIQRMYQQTLPMVSRVSDAMSAVSSSEDSGVLFERKYQINRIANVLLDKYVMQLVNNIGEAYYYQFQITHGDLQKDIKKRTGGVITINKKEVIAGQEMIVNSVSELPRSKVVVTESKNNPVYQLRKKAEIEAILRSIPPTDTLRLQGALSMYFDNMSMSDDARAMQETINELEMKKAMLQYATEISTMETQLKQNKVVGQQLTMSMAQMMPQPDIQPAVQQPGGANPNGSQPVPPGPNPMNTQDLSTRAANELPQEAAV